MMRDSHRAVPLALLYALATAGTSVVHADAAAAALSARISALIAEVEDDVGDVPLQQVEILRDADRSILILVDVRSPAERDVSVITGAISLAELEQLRPIPKVRVIVYCTIGLRSGHAARALRARGYDAFNLRGGVLAWLAAGGALVDRQGKPAQRVHVYGRRWNAVPASFESVW